MVKVTIDGLQVSVSENTTILDAAKKAGLNIPTLCYLKDINEIGACRICVVEIDGNDQLVTACNNVVLDDMVIYTNSPKVRAARKTNVQLILSQHDSECTSCVRSGNCTLQTLANTLGITAMPFKKRLPNTSWNKDFPLIRDNGRCIKCMRCIQICDKVQATGVWDITNRASRTLVDVRNGLSIEKSDCSLCGQCITHCPTGALRERDDTDRVFDALADPAKTTVVQIAPSVRASWGEAFDLPSEKATVGLLAAALRKMGFDYIFDTEFAADLTIMEEGSEFVERLKNDDVQTLPMFTSCCPGWVRYVKSHYPQFVDQLSSAKSPQQMFGAMVKSYYAEHSGIDAHDIFSVAIMPCVAKKHECAIPALSDACGDPDVDVVLSVREVNRMLRADHLDIAALEEENLDEPFGIGTGSSAIFGATGGVMEAALRSAFYLVTGGNADPDAFKAVRGLGGWKEASFDMAGVTLKVAVASGLGNARALLEAIEIGKVSYDFVEIMACPGGCSGGGGQPIHDGEELAGSRGDILWSLDRTADLRFSHENPAIVTCYRDYLGAPLSAKSEHLLHTDHHLWKMPEEV